MSKIRLGFTPGQRDLIHKLATEQGIRSDRVQRYGFDNGSVTVLLQAMQLSRRVVLGPEFEPPPGGRIHIVRGVSVVLDQEWQASINAAGSNTLDDYDVRKVGDLYLPTGTGVIEDEVILMNFGPSGGNWDRAIAWAEDYALKRTDPRRVFAIGEQKPQLHCQLEMDPMYVVATEECAFGGHRRACGVWWHGRAREASLGYVELYGLADDWFAFSRE